MAEDNNIIIYTESARDPESGHVFWFAKMVWKNHEDYFLHLNGIHSGDSQDMTTTDGGIIDAVVHCIQHLDMDRKYNLDIITKKNRVGLQRNFLLIDSMHSQNWMMGKGVSSREVPDASALRRMYNVKNRIISLNFLSHPEHEVVRQMDLMAKTFREAYYLESGREPQQIITDRPKLVIQNR